MNVPADKVPPREMRMGGGPTRRNTWIAATAGVALAICAVKDPIRAASLPEWMANLRTAEALAAFPRAEVVQVLRSRTLQVKGNGDWHVIEREAYIVREGDAGPDAASVFRGSHRRELTSLRGWHTRSDGETVIEDDVITSQLFGGELYTEDKESSLYISNVGPGSFFGFELEYEDHFGRLSVDQFPSRELSPVLRWEYELTLPKNWSAEGFWIDSLGVVTRDPGLEAGGGRRRWIGGNFPAPAPGTGEPLGPAPISLRSEFLTRFGRPEKPGKLMDSWASVSEWYAEISHEALGMTGPGDDLSRLAAEVTANCASDEARIARIAEYVRSKIGYVQIYLEDGGYRPHSPLDVYATRYGDCKDMSHLAIALLRRSGLEAYPVLTNFHERGTVWHDFPGPSFNHCIVATAPREAPGSYVYFDPTAKSVPYGHLPSALEGGSGLVVGSPADTALVRFPGSDARGNVRRYEITLAFSPDLSAKGSVREAFVGQPAFTWHAYLRNTSEDERRKGLERSLEASVAGTNATAIAWPSIEDPSDSLVITYEVAVPLLGRRMGDQLFLQPDIRSSGSAELFPAPKRTHDIYLEYPARTETHVRVALPPGWTVDELPKPVELANDFGRFARTYATTEGVIEVHRLVETHTTHFDVGRYEQARAWSRALYQADRERVVLRRAP